MKRTESKRVTALVGMIVTVICLAIGTFHGCTAISVSLSCPATLRVGDTATLQANEQNPGGIPLYLWEAFPSDAGSFGTPSQPNTSFQALREGEIIIRLTAADGLFQVVDQCVVQVEGVADVAVSLITEPNPAEVGDIVRLTCESIGTVEITEFAIQRRSGLLVEPVDVDPGVVEFEADREGEIEFRCIGTTADDTESAPAFVTVSILGEVEGNQNVNGNANGNGNANDNVSANQNDNDSSSTVGNDNEGMDNVSGDNENSNSGGRGGRPSGGGR